MFMAFILLPQRPMTMAVVSPGCLAVYHSMAFLKKKFHGTAVWEKTRLDRLHALLVRNQQSALMLNASAEIAIGFMAFMQLLSPGRSVSLVFVYWNFLKMRYNCPDAAKYHKQCWALLGQRAERRRRLRSPTKTKRTERKEKKRKTLINKPTHCPTPASHRRAPTPTP